MVIAGSGTVNGHLVDCPRMSDVDAALETISAHALGEPIPNPTALDAAEAHAGLGLPLPRTRFMLWKRLVIRASRVFLHRQIAFNEAIVRAVAALEEREQWRATEIAGLREDAVTAYEGALEMGDEVPRQLALIDSKLSAAAAATASIDAAVVEQVNHQSELERRLATVEQQAHVGGRPGDVLVERVAALEAIVAEQQSRLEARGGADVLASLAAGSDDRATPRDLDAFYGAFELAFRGSEEAIRERHSEYLDDLKANAEVAVGGVLDIGCGRGELLGLLRDNGIRCIGVDTSEDFVKHNRDAGHECELGDALDYLQSVPAGSFGAITALHVVEHLPHEKALALLDAIRDALRPGGLLVIETPNPTNVIVGAGNFYLDPTHVRPVHPAYLEFAAVERGFVDAEIRPLHPMTVMQVVHPTPDEASDALRGVVENVNRWLFGAQDYALLARRPA